jgi:alkylation response protein AidB-like acyl-CoA dehydrogenase
MSRLSERQIAIRDMTREFIRKEVTPFAAQWDRDAAVPMDTLRKIGALGLFGVCIPEQWGGAGADFTSYVLATEEIAYGDAGVCNMVSASNSYGFKIRRRSASCVRWRAVASSAACCSPSRRPARTRPTCALAPCAAATIT